MSDPLRTDPAPDAPSAADREAKIEQLLLLGLDHYFDAQYDQAINVWSRALFLDRGHARARAYIERARSALAEHQRESEELLQRGLAAFDRGASAEARQLLETAITRGAPRDEALAVLDRIHRLEPLEPLEPLGPNDSRPPGAPDEPSDRPVDSRGDAPHVPLVLRTAPTLAHSLGLAAWLLLAVCVVLAALVTAGAIPLDAVWGRSRAIPELPASAVPAAIDRDPAVPRRGERALGQARVLARGGRLRDALARLDDIAVTDDERVDADRLKGDIQRQLLMLGQSTAAAAISVAGPATAPPPTVSPSIPALPTTTSGPAIGTSGTGAPATAAPSPASGITVPVTPLAVPGEPAPSAGPRP